MIYEPPRITLAEVRQRLSTRGADGELVSAGSGLESEAELRQLLLLIVESGHHDDCCECCLFSRVKKMHPDSFKMAVSHFLRKNMLQILAEECACRNRQKQI